LGLSRAGVGGYDKYVHKEKGGDPQHSVHTSSALKHGFLPIRRRSIICAPGKTFASG
jgi:hypothetical protein